MATLTLNPETTALVMIDLQNGIMGMPLVPHSGPDVISRSVQLASALRQHGGTVVYVHVLMSDVIRLPTDAPPLRDPNAPPPPASASELVPQLDRQPGDIVITKRQWGAFYGTGLDQQLRRRGIRTIIFGGVATNFGVESTARAAFDRGYEVVFAKDAMSSVSAEAHDFAVGVIFPRMGRVRSTSEVLEALSK
jgi:nicotinamidase-related amidase